MAAEAGDVTQQTDDDSAFVDSSIETELSRPPRHDAAEPRFVALVNECRANPVVSRRGYLLITDGQEADESLPIKRWVVSYLTLESLTFPV